MARWRASRWLLGAALVGSAGCAAPAPPAAAPPAGISAPAAPASQPTAGPPPITVTAVPALRALQVPLSAVSAAATPVWVADLAGLFQRHGLDAEVVSMSPATAIQAMLAGNAPVAPTGS